LKAFASYPPRSALVAYSEPGSQATANHPDRGARFISVDSSVATCTSNKRIRINY